MSKIDINKVQIDKFYFLFQIIFFLSFLSYYPTRAKHYFVFAFSIFLFPFSFIFFSFIYLSFLFELFFSFLLRAESTCV